MRPVIITGGSGGIGSAIAALFKERGATPIIADHDTGFDVTDEHDVQRLFAQLPTPAPPYDLVCAAGILARVGASARAVESTKDTKDMKGNQGGV